MPIPIVDIVLPSLSPTANPFTTNPFINSNPSLVGTESRCDLYIVLLSFRSLDVEV
jgi:hypothetical protein